MIPIMFFNSLQNEKNAVNNLKEYLYEVQFISCYDIRRNVSMPHLMIHEYSTGKPQQ